MTGQKTRHIIKKESMRKEHSEQCLLVLGRKQNKGKKNTGKKNKKEKQKYDLFNQLRRENSSLSDLKKLKSFQYDLLDL